MKLTLASGSPRRRELLSLLGLPFDVVSPDIDESVHDGEDPVAYVERLAREKAGAVAADGVVIAADTTVVIDGIILGKPSDSIEATAMLRRLSGRTHEVFSGVAVSNTTEVIAAVERTLVTMTEMTDADIDWYIGTGEPLDRAGAYAIQSIGGVFVTAVEGSVSNVVGLPLTVAVELLRSSGLDPTVR